ncbi:MAG: hypothetical protein E4H40_08405 [Candidatus Brocadiia bacterium]|nr:MAG: hypothetical protein E4H40_08405 [Candidatus Brocadiia bacterium]
MTELGSGVVQRVNYAIKKISEIEGITAPRFHACHFKEFVVDFSETGKSVTDINTNLRNKGIFGGADLGREFPELQNCALYCVTEIHTKQDIDSLADALKEIVK